MRHRGKKGHITTVCVEHCSTMAMVAGNEKKFDTIIDGEDVKHWVGIGWVYERKATPKDRKKYPKLIRKELCTSK